MNDDPAPSTRRVTQAAAVTGRLPVLVLYHRPGRDCGSYSGGGAAEQSSYLTWVGAVADAIGDQRVLVVVEPDAIPQALSGQCAQDGNPAATYAMLASAVEILAAAENTLVYLDAGHPGWIADTAALAGALRDSGAEQADGFSLNVSNFATTADNQTYGDALSAALGDKQYLIDVSRNGRGAPEADPASIDAWCNPPGVALGENPRIGADRALAVGFLWIKEPGASDGNCRDGEPPAGAVLARLRAPPDPAAALRAGSRESAGGAGRGRWQRCRYAESGHPETDRGRGDRSVGPVPTGLPGVPTAGPAQRRADPCRRSGGAGRRR